MDETEEQFENFMRETELALYREYRDISSQFKYLIETDRRLYLANEVSLQQQTVGNDFFTEIELSDVWVWDMYRANRFVQSVRVITYKDVNIEELAGKDLPLPEELRG